MMFFHFVCVCVHFFLSLFLSLFLYAVEKLNFYPPLSHFANKEPFVMDNVTHVKCAIEFQANLNDTLDCNRRFYNSSHETSWKT